jgi:hypothetical protein
MKKIITAALFFLLFTQANAQQKKNSYYLLPQLGLLSGDNFISAQVTVSGGIEKKNISFGIGAGLDYYKMRTVPVFAEMRAAVGKNKKTFAYINAGPNFIWPLKSQFTSHYVYTGGIVAQFAPDKFRTGLYGDAGLGYTFRIHKTNVLLLSVGYSLKTLHQSYTEIHNSPFPPYVLETREREYDYSLNRFVLHAGFKFK